MGGENRVRKAGARLKPVCKAPGIINRIYQRWTRDIFISEDKALTAKRSTPQDKLTKKEASYPYSNSPNEVWTWDITWLNATIKDKYRELLST